MHLHVGVSVFYKTWIVLILTKSSLILSKRGENVHGHRGNEQSTHTPTPGDAKKRVELILHNVFRWRFYCAPYI